MVFIHLGLNTLWLTLYYDKAASAIFMGTAHQEYHLLPHGNRAVPCPLPPGGPVLAAPAGKEGTCRQSEFPENGEWKVGRKKNGLLRFIELLGIGGWHACG
jgi:hypothetical protein